MLDADDHFSNNGKGMNSYCAEGNGKLLYFNQKNPHGRKFGENLFIWSLSGTT